MPRYQLVEVPRPWYEYSYNAALGGVQQNPAQGLTLARKYMISPPQDLPFDTGLYADVKSCAPGLPMSLGQKLIWLSAGMLLVYVVLKIITR